MSVTAYKHGSMTQSVYAKKRELGGKPTTFIGGIRMNHPASGKYKV